MPTRAQVAELLDAGHSYESAATELNVPAGQVYVGIEAPRGELGVHAVSDGGTRPYRVHYREPSFVNLQAIPAMAEGGLLADVIAGGASLDGVLLTRSAAGTARPAAPGVRPGSTPASRRSC